MWMCFCTCSLVTVGNLYSCLRLLVNIQGQYKHNIQIEEMIHFKNIAHLKIKMEPRECRFGSYDFPFQTDNFQVPAVNFPG